MAADNHELTQQVRISDLDHEFPGGKRSRTSEDSEMQQAAIEMVVRLVRQQERSTLRSLVQHRFLL